MPHEYDAMHPEPERDAGYRTEPNGKGMSHSPFERRCQVMHDEMVALVPAFRVALGAASKAGSVLGAHEAADGLNAAIALRDALARALRSEPLRAAVDGAIARDLDAYRAARPEFSEDVMGDSADVNHTDPNSTRAA